MEREEALRRLKCIEGQDLVVLARRYEVNIWVGGRKNKGWAGHVVERYLGLPLNSSRAPNFGSWELKVVPLTRLKRGGLGVKETMAICMIDPVDVCAKPFEESPLLLKLRKQIIVARIWESQEEQSSVLYKTVSFDLGDKEIYNQIKDDYETARDALVKAKGDINALSGKTGRFVQPRTKGTGHGSTSRAFYARRLIVKIMLGFTDPWHSSVT